MTESDRLAYLLYLDFMSPAEIDLAFSDIIYHLALLDAEGDSLLAWEVTS